MSDHCGSSGDHWFLKTISFLVPDKPFGVNIVPACKSHDGKYDVRGANKKADLEFKDDILDCFYIHVEKQSWKEWQKTAFYFVFGYFTAYLYYFGVRFGGLFYKLAKSEKFKRFVAMLDKVPPEIQAIVTSFVLSILCSIYMREQRDPLRVLFEGSICGILTWCSGYGLTAMDLDPNWLMVCAGIIAFTGTVTIQVTIEKTLKKWLNK